MKTKNIVFATLLISIGLALNTIMPPFVGLMKPDFLLAMYLIALTQVKHVKETVIVIVLCAILSSLTTMMPGAEVANFIEKILTGISVSFVFNLIYKKSNKTIACVIGGGGTMLSGFLFLLIMNALGFLDGNLLILLSTVVIPTSFMNVFIFSIFYKVSILRVK